MTRGKRLTQDEIDKIRRLKQNGDKIKEIENKTGHSHTTIVGYTKDIQPSSLLSTPSSPPGQKIAIPTSLPKRTETGNSFGSYVPSQAGPYIGSNQYQQEIEEQQRKQKNQQGFPNPHLKAIEKPLPSNWDTPAQTEDYVEPNLDQYNPSDRWMYGPGLDLTPFNQKKLQAEKQKQFEQQQAEEAEKKRKHIDSLTQQYQDMNKSIQEIKKQEDEKKRQEVEQSIRTRMDFDRKQRDIEQKQHEQFMKGLQEIKEQLTTTPSKNKEKNTIANQNKLPENGTPFQPSAENKPSPINKPSRTPPDFPTQEPGGISNAESPYSHLDSTRKKALIETTPNDSSETNKNIIEIPDVIVLGTLYTGYNILRALGPKYGYVLPPLGNKKTDKTKKVTKNSNVYHNK